MEVSRCVEWVDWLVASHGGLHERSKVTMFIC